jgi:membrane-associated phospholipid phosphatase
MQAIHGPLQGRRAAPVLLRGRPADLAAHSAHALTVVYALISLYGVASIGLMVTHRVGLTSEHAILLVLIAAGLAPRLRSLVRAFLPFLFVAVMFEDLGAIRPLVEGSVRAAGPAAFERGIFGGVDVSSWLQQHLGGLHGVQWWQIPLIAEYLAHFVAPILAGLWLWWRFRARFGEYVAAYSLVMAAGFAVYLLFPEMPPWLASQHGLLSSPVQRDVVSALHHVPVIGGIYAGADLYPNGAMPSLHVAVPMVIALSVIGARGGGRRRWLWLLYPLTVGFAVVDLGEHYVADVVVGLVFGALCYAVTSLRVNRVLDRAIPTATKPVVSSSAVVSEGVVP